MKETFHIFKGKKVFITGHTGFKGAWLAFWLSELGAEVTGYALPPEYPESLFDSLKLSERVHHIVGDIGDGASLKKSLLDAQPEFVFHLAAQALVRRSYTDPYLTFHTNVMGSLNLLEAVRYADTVRSLVYITSDKCYKNKEWVWGYRETDELGGPDPYSASKACAEHVFASYYLSFLKDKPQLACGVARAGNVIGGGDRSKDRIVPDIMRALEARQPIQIRNPLATRPWQHVLDPLAGYLQLASYLYKGNAGINGEAFNFGPSGQSICTVHELARQMVTCWGAGEIEVAQDAQAPHESTLLHLAIDKARDLLQWKPRLDFSQTVEWTTAWYKTLFEGGNVQALTSQQIYQFMEF